MRLKVCLLVYSSGINYKKAAVFHVDTGWVSFTFIKSCFTVKFLKLNPFNFQWFYWGPFIGAPIEFVGKLKLNIAEKCLVGMSTELHNSLLAAE